MRAALPLSWLCLPPGVVPRRFDAAVGRTRVLPEVRGQITERMLTEARAAGDKRPAQVINADNEDQFLRTPSDAYGWHEIVPEIAPLKLQ